MYAEHVLKMKVDWSTLPSSGLFKLGDALLKRRPIDIPYSPVPDWFRIDSKLYDEPRIELPPSRIGPSSRRRTREAIENEDSIERPLDEAFAIMDVDREGEVNMDESTTEAILADVVVTVGKRGGHRGIKRGDWDRRRGDWGRQRLDPV